MRLTTVCPIARLQVIHVDRARRTKTRKVLLAISERRGARGLFTDAAFETVALSSKLAAWLASTLSSCRGRWLDEPRSALRCAG
jgi:hypothetical protein